MTPRASRRTPFELLGLPASREVTDDDVRAAWRRIAAATHPDRADGGDPERFALASAAYTALRTRFGRGEVLADLAGQGVTVTPDFPAAAAPAPPAAAAPAAGAATAPARPAAAAPAPGAAAPTPPAAAAPAPARAAPRDARPAPATVLPGGRWAGRLFWRIRRGRPGVLALRVAIAAAVGVVSVAAIGFAPSALALITGAATWLALTARNDLAPPGPG